MGAACWRPDASSGVSGSARESPSLSKRAARYPRASRLTRPNQFARVFKQPYRSVDRCFTVLYRPNSLRRSRLGLAITRKRVRTAVARHRIKRQVRESFRLAQHLLVGLDLVVLARDSTAARANVELRDSLAKHWQRIHDRCEGS